ncbi:MAG: putative tRNA (cytidine(34)-2'-O)-methyltransferase [Pirellulaceae bacterium]|nr:MAG: putative tRNA (cytidine(34)-2'-O)-methyltransferase [Pirellulaceae bacterium]
MSREPWLHVVLYQPEIPQNTGNIGRTCVAVGAKLWLVRPLGFRLDDARLRRAGLDYWQHLDYEVVDDWQQLRQRLSGNRYWFFSKWAERPCHTVDFAAGDVLVFGSETSGLPESLRRQWSANLVRIPMRGAARSLNLASAVAVGVYTAVWRSGWTVADESPSEPVLGTGLTHCD